MPSQRDISHDSLRQTFLLSLFERSKRQTASLNSPYIETDDVEASERNNNSPASKRFDRPASERFNHPALEEKP
jgi:hypothetical protein